MAGISSKASGKLENNYKYNGIEHNTDFDLNMYDAFYRNLDPQIGRFWQIDPKPNVGFSSYSSMANNPILFSDYLGDTTYRFNSDGVYLGMYDLDQSGIRGSVGNFSTVKDVKGNAMEQWNSSASFSFNDPELDQVQLNSMEVGKVGLQFVSDEEINGIMDKSGIESKNFVGRWFFAGTESGSGRDRGDGNKMDFGVSYLGGQPGGGDGDAYGGFFIFGNQRTAFNSMDGGNWLWGQGMSRLGFDYSSAQIGSQSNESFKDSKADQRAIRSGFHHKVGTTKSKSFVLKNAP
jgi:RHS repeat-associated protein